MTTENLEQRYVFAGNAAMDQFMARRTAEVEAAFLLPHLKPGLSLVDIGCGQGTITAGLAEMVTPGRVLGFDLQPEHIERARALADERGLTNVDYEVGDIYNPPCEPESFDAAFAHVVYSHLRDPERALGSAFRILKPGGIIATRDRGGDILATGPLAEYFKRARAIIEDTQDALSSSPHGARLGLMMNRLCREAGFEVVSISATWEVTRVSEIAATIPRFFLAGTSLGERAIQAGVATQAEIDELTACVEAQWHNDPDGFVATPWFEVVARKPR